MSYLLSISLTALNRCLERLLNCEGDRPSFVLYSRGFEPPDQVVPSTRGYDRERHPYRYGGQHVDSRFHITIQTHIVPSEVRPTRTNWLQ